MSVKNRVDEIESLIDCMSDAINDYALDDEGIDVASARLHGYYSAAGGLLWSLYAQEFISDAKLFQRMQELGTMTNNKVFGLIQTYMQPKS